MGAVETLNAAILQLRAKALESYGVMKDLGLQEGTEGNAERVANQALKLAQYEGALVTLQRNIASILESKKEEEESEDVEDAEEEESRVVTPDMSPTLRRTTAAKPFTIPEDE